MAEPLRILELRSVTQSGGGPEKTILLGTARTDPARFAVTVCYLRDRRDPDYDIHERAQALGVDYVEVLEDHSFDPKIWPRLVHLVRQRRIDIVHAHEYKTDLLALGLALRCGVIAMATVHGWTGHSFREQLYYAADKRLLSRLHHTVAVSGQIRQVLLDHGARPERSEVVLNAIDHERFVRDPALVAEARAELGLGPGDFALASIGRLAPQKRFDVFIEVFAELARTRPQLRAFVVGEGDESPALEALIEKHGLRGRCTLLGLRHDVPRLHHAFDLYVQTSDYEGTPNTVLEAMALSTPVVATRAGGTEELLRDPAEGWLTAIGDHAALVRCISEALADDDARRARAAAARRRIETVLSFEARMARIEGIYETLVQRFPSRLSRLRGLC